MPRPVIITAAITGAVPRKKDNPAVPVSPAEQIESTHEAYAAGASLLHVHVREPDESSSSDPEKFAEVQAGVSKHCPGMIIQFSTGGRGRSAEQRSSALYLKPDMASLSTGSVNFPNIVYLNPIDLVESLSSAMLEYDIKPEIEVFDLSMLYAAQNLMERGLLKAPLHVQFVMGVKNAMPARREAFEFMVKELHDLMPDATWTGAGIGREQLVLNRWSAELGGHIRTGLEDNVRRDREHLAKSNADLVELAIEVCHEYDCRPATPAEAREILSLPPAN